MIILTPKKNEANITYSVEGIPNDGPPLFFPRYIGYTLKNNIIIQPDHRDDKGLLLHELTHVDQWKEYCFWNIRYNNSKEFRLKMEAEAFAAQLFGNGNLEKLKIYANELSTKYNLDRSVEVCENMILKFYRGCIENE